MKSGAEEQQEFKEISENVERGGKPVFEKMLEDAAKGGPEGEEAIRKAERQKLIDACQEAGIQPPDDHAVEGIIEEGRPKIDFERDWEERQEERNERLFGPNGLQVGGE